MYCQHFTTWESLLIAAFVLFAFADDINDLGNYIVNRAKKYFNRKQFA